MKFEKIKNYIMRQVDEGVIKPGEKMPSIRKLCEDFNCSKTTAVRAYYDLKENGIVYAVPGSGYYLIGKVKTTIPEKGIIDLSGSELDKDVIPYDDFESCLNQAIKKYKGELFGYTEPQGLSSLISILEKQLQNSQVFSKKEKIFITTGSQQALNILSRLSFPNGKENILLEQPTYLGIIQGLSLNRVNGIGIKRGFWGLDFDQLEDIFRNDNVKFFYTISRFSNPLGLNYTKMEKEKLVFLANKYDVYIVEDDYLGDFENDTKSDPLFSYDTQDRIIYLKTFSRLLLPGLRLAVVVVPNLLIDSFKKYKYYSDFSTPVLSQGALEIYISSGLFDLHINKIREKYLKRMKYLRKISKENELSYIRWHIPENGVFYSSLEIFNDKSVNNIVDELNTKNILLTKMDKYYLKEFYNDKILRLSVANVNLQQMKKAVSVIIGLIKQEN